jgi:hypothetical protein
VKVARMVGGELEACFTANPPQNGRG